MHHGGANITRDGSNLTFILNPRSRNYFPGFRNLAAEKWPGAKFFVSSNENELYDFIGKTAGGSHEQPPVVVACGGDGTFRIVASAVGNNAILGIVPMGTVNLVAYQLGIPKNIPSAMDLLENGRLSRIYPGCCTWDETGTCRLFFLSVSMGVDADSVHYISGLLKTLLGRNAYALSFLSRLFFHSLPRVEYTMGGRKSFSNGIIVASSECYGGRNIISKSQSLYKPGIEIISIRPGKRNVLGFFLALFLGIGRHTDFASFTTGTRLEMSCPPHGRFQIDGDRLSATRISVRSMDTPLTVIADRTRAISDNMALSETCL